MRILILLSLAMSLIQSNKIESMDLLNQAKKAVLNNKISLTITAAIALGAAYYSYAKDGQPAANNETESKKAGDSHANQEADKKNTIDDMLSTKGIVIRKYNKTDAHKIFEIIEDSKPFDAKKYYEEKVRSLQTFNQITKNLYVLINNNKIIGFISYSIMTN